MNYDLFRNDPSCVECQKNNCVGKYVKTVKTKIEAERWFEFDKEKHDYVRSDS